MKKIETKKINIKNKLLLGASILALSPLLQAELAQAQNRMWVPRNCDGQQQRPVPCVTQAGIEVADSYCNILGPPPIDRQACTWDCGQWVTTTGGGDGDGGGDGGGDGAGGGGGGGGGAGGAGGGGGAGDPLILDLDGNGISLSCAEDGVMFDMDNDGDLDQSGWVDPGDGLLVFDDNGNGIIENQSELLGNDDITAYEELATFDSNNDGIFDSNDDTWSDFKVWQDINQDGISQASELKTLDHHGITKFDLGFQRVESQSDENRITGVGFFERIGGAISQVIETFLRFLD